LRQFTALHVKGDALALDWVIDAHNSEAVQSLSEAIVLRIPVAALRQLADQRPPAVLAFWKLSVAESKMPRQWTVNKGLKDAKSKLAHLICELAVRTRASVDTNHVRLIFR
jgi:CRP-like cAMP-binding protein